MEEVRKYTTKADFQRYSYLKTRSEIPGHYIFCTNPKCDGSQPHLTEAGPKMVCQHCGALTCANHKLPWHEGKTCEEFDISDEQLDRLDEAEMTAKLLTEEGTSICPNPECGQAVSKLGGCDHMTCRCGNNWCNICGVTWDGSTPHRSHCRYSTASYHDREHLTKKQNEEREGIMLTKVHGGLISQQVMKARDEKWRREAEEAKSALAATVEARTKESVDELMKQLDVADRKGKKKATATMPGER